MYPEVYKFDNTCGVLCSHLRYKNSMEHGAVDSCFRTMVNALYTLYKARLIARNTSSPRLNDEELAEFHRNYQELKSLYKKWRKAVIGVRQHPHRQDRSHTKES